MKQKQVLMNSSFFYTLKVLKKTPRVLVPTVKPGVLLDGSLPRNDDGRHPGVGGGDQEGARRGERQGGNQGDRRPRVGEPRQHLDHRDLDQRIHSTDKEHPWDTRSVLPKQATFKETVVRHNKQANNDLG